MSEADDEDPLDCSLDCSQSVEDVAETVLASPADSWVGKLRMISPKFVESLSEEDVVFLKEKLSFNSLIEPPLDNSISIKIPEETYRKEDGSIRVVFPREVLEHSPLKTASDSILFPLVSLEPSGSLSSPANVEFESFA